MLLGIAGLFAWTIPQDSPMRSPGTTAFEASGEGMIHSLYVDDGDTVDVGQELGIIQIFHLQSENEDQLYYEPVRKDTMMAMEEGVIHFAKPDLREGSTLQAGEMVATLQGSRDVTAFDAPVMQSIVPLIFLLFVIPGVIYGFLAGTFKNSQDMVGSMSKAMGSMAYYIVMAFFCALFIDAFGNSNIGTLIALKGAGFLESLALPGALTIVGIIVLTAVVNLLVGSASAKWALISPIFVPMLMGIGISPDLTQAAYRVGDSVSNIITPLLPYFPLVVVFCQRYVKSTGIGTLVSMMLPYFFIFMVTWSIFLLVYWWIGIPLGLQASYTFP
ncbi:AbgT family transporter [Natronogracilivirgula saccharolytica]|uniref:AbgT family transporter n=2 Tax=Natronogracilivirga saccharolytica TaxID=2812953 RepID=A0A8J7RHI2_9BACT|nr:AbgT family transporter [Natronogracilivirga saccharolytica]